MNVVFNIAEQPIQSKLWNMYEASPATIIGMGGSRGGSKTHTADDVMLRRRGMYANTWGVIIMRVMDDLRDLHIRPMIRRFPFLKTWYNKNESIINLPNGSFIRFISGENDGDIESKVGKEFADIAVDQAERFMQKELEFLKTINRCTTNDKITPKMLWTFNPGGVSHSFMKRVFIQKSFTGNERPEDFSFLKANGWDNAFWCRKDLRKQHLSIKDFHSWDDKTRFNFFITHSDYGRNLNSLPENQRRAQLFGDFDVYEGQFFDIWREDLHVIDPMMPPHGTEVMGAIDYGNRTVFSAGFKDWEGNVVQFMEVFSEDTDPQSRAIKIALALQAKQLKRLPVLYDTNMEVDLSNYVVSAETPIQTFRRVFDTFLGEDAPILIPVSKRPTDNRNYRSVINEAYYNALSWQKNDDGSYARRPKLYITRDCKGLVETLPLLQRDKESPEGLDFIRKQQVEDYFDASKYMLSGLIQPSEQKRVKVYEYEHEYINDTIFNRILARHKKPRINAAAL